MKVAVVHSYYSSRQSSGENVVVDAQVAAMREFGLDVEVIAARTDDLEQAPGYASRAALRVATGRGGSPLEQIEAINPDVVHVHNLFPNWGTQWLSKWERPIVATVHNFRPVCAAGTLFRDGKVCTACPDSSALRAIQHACYRGSRVATLPLAVKSRGGVSGDRLLSRADRVILLTARARGLYEGFGLEPQKIEVIPNFVRDLGAVTEAPGRPGWAYTGRLSAEKGILNLVRHWPAMESLDVYGDGPLRGELEVLAKAHGKVTIHGSISHSEVPQALANARGLVFPSECPEGGVPQSYVEALSAGRMVVALGGSSAADDLIEAGAGVVFATWDELGQALDEAFQNVGIFSRRAREHYLANYRASTFLERMAALYDTMVDQSRSSHA
ncbi:glycosyltransferase family 4 protein [Cryobacterium sp. SO2]|uniref:glycosyltransferase family 4 protein n=1 Tax=Cryobacterium sp. SO2 TaxID=1897060 RepID=UPI00223D55DF|nr:glycosyltransferase family 4 protein [Cryobacterium sp. SO2]WEO77980.1 glycosyltransferase family 4 protein [Cryobacterium sp. SO2]